MDEAGRCAYDAIGSRCRTDWNAMTDRTESSDEPDSDDRPCSIGAFSISLAVKDLAASTQFYGRLGFTPLGGDGEMWSILTNGNAVVGLFQGMFDDNILTFNPGWAGPGHALDEFEDVRAMRNRLVADGVEVQQDTTQDSESGPASFVLIDPDGNPVLIDQHV